MWSVLPWLAMVVGAALALRCRNLVAAAVVRMERLAGLPPRGDLVQRIDACADVLAPRVEPREERHGITGLPTREPLLAAIATAERGTLGLVALADYDRLAAFDPALAERVLMVLVERLDRMVGGRRPLAQVDRGRFALWYGAETDPDEARAEITAIAYALGDAIPGEEIVPEIGSAHARWPEDGDDPPALLGRALAALALRPAASAGPAGLADAADETRDRYLLEQDLRYAVERHEFRLCYQPLIDADAGRVVGAEALIRWHHPRRGLVSPATFMPVVEAMGLADEVGAWVLNTAAREARGWQLRGFGHLRVAVNVSGHQLARADMRLMVERTLARHDLSPDRLEIELTESVATTDPVQAAALFDELRTLGIRIAIDDFGTGFSSFGALRRLRFDKIKIDREFVTAVDTRRDGQAICQAIIALARGLGTGVLAEGVERHEEYEWLRAQGCSLFQGFHFAEPFEPDAFAVFVTDRAALAHRLGERPANDWLRAVR